MIVMRSFETGGAIDEAFPELLWAWSIELSEEAGNICLAEGYAGTEYQAKDIMQGVLARYETIGLPAGIGKMPREYVRDEFHASEEDDIP